MKKQVHVPYSIDSISELHRLLGLPRPKHPLISVFNYEEIQNKDSELLDIFSPKFYCIAIKKNFTGKLRYGHRYYDFDEGMMSFISPGQLLAETSGNNTPTEGFCLMFHADFLAGYPLARKIKSYGFFSYETSEALHLCENEETMIDNIMQSIREEYESRIDIISQDVMISQIEILLHYSSRFYNRQFITRKPANNDLMAKMEKLLDDYFDNEIPAQLGLPTVQYISDHLHVSPNYLSDMLRTITGQSTQHHIQDKLIERAKEILTSTTLSVSEIAYQLGFQQPQSFSKLFKNKANITPQEYRQTLNKN